MVAPSSSTQSNDNRPTERRVILIGLDGDRIKAILADDTIIKLVIFDDTDNARTKFDKVYPVYRDRITLYEGDIEKNLDGYLKLREKEGIAAEMHRLEVLNTHFRLFVSPPDS